LKFSLLERNPTCGKKELCEAHVEICPPRQSPTTQDQHREEEKWSKSPSNRPFAGCSLGFRYFQELT
jgi:hypothetical protein